MRSETRSTSTRLCCGTPIEGAFCGQCGVQHQPALDRVAPPVTASSASAPTAPARNVGAVLAIVKAVDVFIVLGVGIGVWVLQDRASQAAAGFSDVDETYGSDAYESETNSSEESFGSASHVTETDEPPAEEECTQAEDVSWPDEACAGDADAQATLEQIREDSFSRTELDGRWVAMLSSKFEGVQDSAQLAENGSHTFYTSAFPAASLRRGRTD